MMARVNLLRGHGSPTLYQYQQRGCRCAICRAAVAEYRSRLGYDLKKRSAYDRRYRAEHPDKAVYMRRYRAAHIARTSERNRAYAAKHPALLADIARNRRARKLNAPGTYTDADVQAQYARQRGKCYWRANESCKARGGKLGDDYHPDHVVPLILGGSNWPSNLVVSCPACNCSKGGKHPMEFAGVML